MQSSFDKTTSPLEYLSGWLKYKSLLKKKKMKTSTEKRLFWFLKDETKLDLSKKSHLDMYIQQTLSRGKTSDIKKLLNLIKASDFLESFNRIKNFLPKEVKTFWEESFGDINRPAKKDTQHL
jgi:uncharacterized membrane protein YheB (UPF0754 family)